MVARGVLAGPDYSDLTIAARRRLALFLRKCGCVDENQGSGVGMTILRQ